MTPAATTAPQRTPASSAAGAASGRRHTAGECATAPFAGLPCGAQGCLALLLRAVWLCCTAGAACGDHPAAGEHRMLGRALREPGVGGSVCCVHHGMATPPIWCPLVHSRCIAFLLTLACIVLPASFSHRTACLPCLQLLPGVVQRCAVGSRRTHADRRNICV